MKLHRDDFGAAMLEYSLVSCIVVLAALAPYVDLTGSGTDSTGSLVAGYTRQCKSAVQFISLPCP